MTTPNITVRVLLFAAYREAVGTRELTLEVEEGATVEDVYTKLAQDHAALDDLREYTTFAVNRDVVDVSRRLKSGDEIAFLQPLSGGRA